MRGGGLAGLGGPARPLSLTESASVLGGLRWVELGAFARLGAVATSGEGLPPVLRVWAASSSFAHAWRAEQLLELLPVSAGLPDADECTVSPGLEAERALDELTLALSGPASVAGGDGLGRLVSWYGSLAAAYDMRRTFVQLSADGPVVRVLERIGADVRSGTAALGVISNSIAGNA